MSKVKKKQKQVGVIITFVFDAAFVSVRYISEANWKFPPWGHRRTLPVVLAWAGCGFPPGVQDVNRADRLPVILQEMRGWGFCGKKGVRVCVFIPARSRHVFSDESGASESSGGLTDMWWNVVGVCVLKCAFTPWPSELLLFSGIENEKFGKKRGSKETEEFISTKKHHSRTTSTLHVFRAVTQTACSGKMFHWNLMGHLLLWALTCVCLCVCVCLAGAHQTHAGVSLAEV